MRGPCWVKSSAFWELGSKIYGSISLYDVLGTIHSSLHKWLWACSKPKIFRRRSLLCMTEELESLCADNFLSLWINWVPPEEHFMNQVLSLWASLNFISPSMKYLSVENLDPYWLLNYNFRHIINLEEIGFIYFKTFVWSWGIFFWHFLHLNLLTKLVTLLIVSTRQHSNDNLLGD